MREPLIIAAHVCLIMLTVWVLWQLPDRAGTAFLGSSLAGSDNAAYHEYKYILWPLLSVSVLWITYYLIVRLTRSRSPVS